MKSIINKRVDTRLMFGIIIAMFCAMVLAFQLPVLAANTFPGVYDLVSVNNVDNKGVNSNAAMSGISHDGQRILFTSAATNLPGSNSSSMSAGYIRNMTSGVTNRVDVSTSGVPGDKWSAYYVMSTSGRYIAFVSYATNLIDGTVLTSFARVYVKDLQTGSIGHVTNVQPAGGSVMPSSISDDGRFVGILTNSVNDLVPGTRTGANLSSHNDSLIYDRSKNTWTVVKGINDVALNNPIASVPNASCDGSLAVFSSSSNNLTNNYSGSGQHVFLVDVRNGMFVEDLTIGATGDTLTTQPSISCNGRYVVYTTKDRTVVSPTPTGMNSAAQVVRLDRLTGERKYLTNQTYVATYEYEVAPASVTDSGDVVLSSGPNTNLYNRKVYFMHLSDGSGTQESVHHVYQGLNYEPQFTPTYLVSSNGKYVAVSSKAAEYLGLIPVSGNGTNIPSDIIRVKTGL